MSLIDSSQEILFYGDQINPVCLIAEFCPSSDLAKINRTFEKNVNFIRIKELLKLRRYFFSQNIVIESPKAGPIVKRIQELLSEVFDIFNKLKDKTRIEDEDNVRINEISTEIFTMLQEELKELEILSRTMHYIDKNFGKNSFYHESLIRMFEKINHKYLDLRKENLLIHLSVIFITFFSIVAITCFIFVLIVLIKMGIFSIKIDSQKDLIFENIARKILIDIYEEKYGRGIAFLRCSHSRIDIVFFNNGNWACSPFQVSQDINNIILNIYENTGKVQDLIKFQKSMWVSFFLKEFLPLSLIFCFSLAITIISIVIICCAIESKYTLKEQNPDATRYINY